MVFLKQGSQSQKINSLFYQKEFSILRTEDTSQKLSFLKSKNLSYYQMGLQCVQSQEYSRALNYFFKEISHNPVSYVTWNLVGSLFYREGLFDLAKFCFNYAQWLKSDYINFLVNDQSSTSVVNKSPFVRQRPSFVHVLI